MVAFHLEGGFGPFLDGFLNVLLAMIFGAVLTVNFDPLFGRFSDDDLRVYLRFRDLKCRFWPILDAFLNVLLDVDCALHLQADFGSRVHDDPDRPGSRTRQAIPECHLA